MSAHTEAPPPSMLESRPMYIDTIGSGSTHVVFLHGLPQDPSDLQRIADAAADRVCSHVVHLPGYGRSAPATLPYSLDAVVEELEADLGALGVSRAIVVGMSGGAYRAFQLATRGKLGVDAVVCLGALARVDEPTAQALRGFADALEAGVDVGAAGAARAFSPAYLAAHPECEQMIVELFEATPVDMLASELRAFAEAPDLSPKLSAIDVPVVLRVGDLDQATPPEVSRALVEIMPHAELQIVAGAGHMLPYEDLEATTAAVLDAIA